MTREHLFPDGIHRRMLRNTGQESGHFWTRKGKRDFSGDLVIKDVCADCNNNVLGDLDAYGCRLYDRYFGNDFERGDRVVFKYDYGRLSRWILKILYNSSRVNQSDDRGQLEKTSDYILGKVDSPVMPVQLGVFLKFPEKPPKELASQLELPRDGLFRPEGNRVGFYLVRSSDGRELVLRALHLKSFTFLVGLHPDKVTADEASAIMRFVISSHIGGKVISSANNRVRLICKGQGAFQSFMHGRSNWSSLED